jgi:predicted NBD/HSP70 family sugar kinase
VPGFIDHPAGTVTYPALGWERVPMQSALEGELGVPVGLLSLPAAMLAGEIVSGAAAGHDDAVLVLLEHGIGAGILSRGRLVVGSGGAVGELGHCPVSSGLPCLCGRQGCLETVAAGWAIRAEAQLGDAGLAELERLGDPRIDAVLERAATELGAGAAWLVNLLDPSIVVLADTPFTRGADEFLRAFEASTRRQAIRPDVEIVRGSPDARLRGAVQAALELLPEQLRPRRVMCG